MPLEDIARQGRMIQFRYPNGVKGWLVTNYDDYREVLGPRALHAKHFQGKPQLSPVSVELPTVPGLIASMNGPEHIRMRRMVAGECSMNRIEEFKPTINAIIDKHLDQMDLLVSPLDPYANYNLPVPSELIATILGVPEDHTTEFQEAAKLTMGGLPKELEDPSAPKRAVAALDPIIGILLDDEDRRRTVLQNPDRVPQAIEGLIKFRSMFETLDHVRIWASYLSGSAPGASRSSIDGVEVIRTIPSPGSGDPVR